MLRFFQPVLEYNPDNAGIVVYNETAKIWIADKRTGLTMMSKKHTFTQTYLNYRRAVNRLSYADDVRGGGNKVKAMKRLKAADSAAGKLEPLPTSQKPLVEDLIGAWEKTFGGFSKAKMNHCRELVPMNDGNCYEVRTGRIIPRTKDMYFTSQLNGTVKHDALDAECAEIRRWFMEIARERRYLAEYMRRVCGLLLTSMEFDRKFYVNLGKGSNGKSVLYKILEVLMGLVACVS